MRALVALTLLLAVVVVGCGGNDTADKTAATDETPVVTEAPAVSAETRTQQPTETLGADLLATATELADTWAAGWSRSDPEMVASVFSDDGLYISFNGSTHVGPENADHVSRMASQVADVVRVGDVTETPEGTFVWVVEAQLAGAHQRGTLEAVLDGDRISQLTWAEDPVVIE